MISTTLPPIEYISLKYDLKPAVRMWIDKIGFENLRRMCKEDNFKFKWRIYKNKYLLYIAKSKNILERIYNLEKKYFLENKKVNPNKIFIKNLHMKIGKLLGYPTCCSTFFAENSTLSNTERIKLAYCSSKMPIKFYMNNLHYNVHYSFYRILDYFCCSYSCKESEKLCKEKYKILKMENLQEARKIKFILSLPTFFFDQKHTILFVGKFKNNCLRYKKILTPDSFLPKKIKYENKFFRNFIKILKMHNQLHYFEDLIVLENGRDMIKLNLPNESKIFSFV